MKPVYVEKDGDLRHFIFNFYDSQDKETWELEFERISTISASAFKNVTGLEKIFFDDELKFVKKEAFANCEDLNLFCCCNLSNKKSREEEKSIVKNISISKTDKFTIEAFAFSECKNISTIVLPECKKLIIEKGAFSGCSVLRSFVSFAEEIDFTENPFEDCPESLTFVGKKNSGLERFAREYGYRFIDD